MEAPVADPAPNAPDAIEDAEPYGYEKYALLGIAIVISVTHVTVPPWGVVLTVIGSLLVLVLSGDKRQRWGYVAIGVVLLYSIVMLYTLVGNHLFLLAYMVWALALQNDDHEALAPTFRGVLVAVMLIAATQKIINPYFISGDALAWYIASGESYGNLIAAFDPAWADQTARVFADARAAMTPTDGSTPTSVPPGAFMGAMVALSWFVFAFEIFVALSWLKLPGKLAAIRAYAPHITFAFVWGTYTMRNEPYFFALVTLLAVFGIPRDRERGRLWWFGMGTLAFMLVVGFFGFRPPFLQ